MPVRTYRQSAIAQYGGISFLATLLSIIALVDGWKDIYIISIPVAVLSGLLSYALHYGERHRLCTSVPV